MCIELSSASSTIYTGCVRLLSSCRRTTIAPGSMSSRRWPSSNVCARPLAGRVIKHLNRLSLSAFDSANYPAGTLSSYRKRAVASTGFPNRAPSAAFLSSLLNKHSAASVDISCNPAIIATHHASLPLLASAHPTTEGLSLSERLAVQRGSVWTTRAAGRQNRRSATVSARASGAEMASQPRIVLERGYTCTS